MPELPEVETTRRGIAPHVVGARITGYRVRQSRLRWPVELPASIIGARVDAVARRAKYLGLVLPGGGVLIHLGMSGHLRVVGRDDIAGRHAHVDIEFDNGRILRLTDPRRFGSILYQVGDWLSHPLLAGLGPEPLTADFDGDYLFAQSRRRRVPIKSFIMDARVVVGVGNIYANEALFRAGLRPRRAAGRVSRAEYVALADAIRQTLTEAVAAGGTTLRDFLGSDGAAGYFSTQLSTYGRAGLPCTRCGAQLKGLRLAQRATVYCPKCQR